MGININDEFVKEMRYIANARHDKDMQLACLGLEETYKEVLHQDENIEQLQKQNQKALEYLDLWQSHNKDTDVLISIQDLRNILERKS